MIDDTARPNQPRWLLWAREMQALAQTGLTYAQDPFDHERYQRLRTLAAQIMADHTAIPLPDIEVMFSEQSGYATPKVGVRGAVFSRGGSSWFGKSPMSIAGPCPEAGPM
jgi:hypothetical protein